jgi:hypothetical protein
MPSPSATPTPITPPRVPFIDARTGLIDRAWYQFFLSLYRTADTVVNDSVSNLGLESLIASYDAALQTLGQEVHTQPPNDFGSLQQQIDALRQEVQTLPVFDTAAIFSYINALYPAPVTKTADFSVLLGEVWLINNKSGSSCTVTLPTPSLFTGRVLYFLNYQPQTLVSASSNVVPLSGGAATTAILEAVAGANATLVSNGTNWVMTQYDSNNALQLE